MLEFGQKTTIKDLNLSFQGNHICPDGVLKFVYPLEPIVSYTNPKDDWESAPLVLLGAIYKQYINREQMLQLYGLIFRNGEIGSILNFKPEYPVKLCKSGVSDFSSRDLSRFLPQALANIKEYSMNYPVSEKIKRG